MSEKMLFKKKHDLEFKFHVRRVAEGNFKGLWQLEAKLPDSTEFVEIVDCDHLSTVISKIGYVFEQEGL